MDREAQNLAQTRIYSDEPGKEGWSSSDWKFHRPDGSDVNEEGQNLLEDNPDFYKNMFRSHDLVSKKKKGFFRFGGKKNKKTKKRNSLSRKSKKSQSSKRTKRTKRTKRSKKH
jgi:hypothetical protein